MGVLKGFRKYNRVLLAGFTALLMVSFLIGGTFKGCGSDHTTIKVATFFNGGYSVTLAERYAARVRWQYVHAVYQAALMRHLRGAETTARGSNAPSVLAAAFQAWRPCKQIEKSAGGAAQRAQLEMQFGFQFGGVSDLVPLWVEFGPVVGMLVQEFSPTPEETLLRLGKAEAARRLGIRVTAKDIDEYLAALGFNDDDLRRAASTMQVSPRPKVDEIREAIEEELLVIGHMASVLSEVHVSEPQLLRFLRQNVDQVTLTSAAIDARDFSDAGDFQPDAKDPKVAEELKKLYEAGKDKVGRRSARGIAEHEPFRAPQREQVFGYKLPDRAAFEVLKVPDADLAKMTDLAKARIAAMSPAARADFEERAFRYYEAYSFRFPAPREEKKEEKKDEKTDLKTPERIEPKNGLGKPKDDGKAGKPEIKPLVPPLEPKKEPDAGKKAEPKTDVGPARPKDPGDKPDVKPEKKGAPVPEKKVDPAPAVKDEKKDAKPEDKKDGKNEGKKDEPSALAPLEAPAVEEEIAFLADEKAGDKPDVKPDPKDAKKDEKPAPKAEPPKADPKPDEKKADPKPEVKPADPKKAPDAKGEPKVEPPPDPKKAEVKPDPTKKATTPPDPTKKVVVDPKKADPTGKKAGKVDDKSAKTPEPDPDARERAEFAKVKETVMVRLMIEDLLEDLLYQQTRPAYRKLLETAKNDAAKVPNFAAGLHPLVGAEDAGDADPKAPKRPLPGLDVRAAFRQEFGVGVEYFRAGLMSIEDVQGSPLEQAVLRGAMLSRTTETRNEDSSLGLMDLVYRTPILETARRDREKAEREKRKTPRRKDEEDEPRELHALDVGDVSGPLRGQTGDIYFLRLLAAEPEKVQTFEEAAAQLAEDYALKKAFEFLAGPEKGRGKAHDIADAAAKSPDSLPSTLRPKTGRATTMHTLFNLDRIQRDALPAARSIIQTRAEMETGKTKPELMRVKQQSIQIALQSMAPLNQALRARGADPNPVGWRIWLSKDNFVPTVIQGPPAGRTALPADMMALMVDSADQQELLRRAFTLLEENPGGVGVLPLPKQFKVVLFSIGTYQPAATEVRGQREVWAAQARSLAAQQLLADYSNPAKLKAILGYAPTADGRYDEDDSAEKEKEKEKEKKDGGPALPFFPDF